MDIAILKDEEYTIQQIKEIMNAFAEKKYTEEEYLSELRVLSEEGLIEIRDTTEEELEEMMRIDGQEQLNSNRDI